jgi:two-component system NarL family sensor kinase
VTARAPAGRTDQRTLAVLAEHHIGRAEVVIGWLRIVAVGLFIWAEHLPPGHDHQTGFYVVAAGYGAWSLLLLAMSSRRAPTCTEGLIEAGVDAVAITLLSSTSGGPYSLVRLGYFFVPVTVAFRYRWTWTLAATAVVVAAYISEAAADIGPDHKVAGFVAFHALMLTWVGVACAGLSAAVARRSNAIEELAIDREQLLAESLAAETRERRALAERLHDGAIQSLLAIRHDLEETALDLPDDPGLRRADDALLAVVRELRSTTFELHPHVLDEAGLDAAVRQVAETAARRAGLEVTLELDQLPARADLDRLMFSVARELLINVTKHAGARHVAVTLHDIDGARVLTVRDDGKGFDTSVLAKRLAQGHIGLASQRVRVESAGGTLDVEPGPEGGTVATARVPV